jgi:hypothetical protein
MREGLESTGQAEWRWTDLEQRFFGPGVAEPETMTETVTVA